MEAKWIENIALIHGIKTAILVDHDGLVVAKAGEASDWVAPHSALMVKRLITEIGAETIRDWLWTQCDTEEFILSLVNVDVGILVLIMEPDANLGLVQVEAGNVRHAIKQTFNLK